MVKNLFIFFCGCIIVTVAMAQKPATQPRATTVQKFKPPKLKCTLGKRADTAFVSVDEAIQLITFPLIVTDDKKNVYTISSYQCMYKRKAVTENEETGKITPITSMVADVFKATPLPEIWKKIITEQLRPGEEIFFFDVVVKDAQGRLMFAPNLKLTVN